jgi:hypothetical protein
MVYSSDAGENRLVAFGFGRILQNAFNEAEQAPPADERLTTFA